MMVQMTVEPFLNVRVMTELLQKVLPDRKDVDRHMINNVRIRARKKVRIGFCKYSNRL